MNNPLLEHYRARFRTYGDSPEAVQYSDAASQERRFGILAEFADELGSVVDVGCGLGHLYEYLRARGFRGRYLGLDLVDEFVQHAARKHAADADAEFRRFDMETEAYPEGYDTFMICGVFNNRMADNEGFMRRTIAGSFGAARRGLAFNAMSTYVDFQDPELYYADPLRTFDYCKRELTKLAVLRHDYLVRPDRPPFEYAMYLYK